MKLGFSESAQMVHSLCFDSSKMFWLKWTFKSSPKEKNFFHTRIPADKLKTMVFNPGLSISNIFYPGPVHLPTVDSVLLADGPSGREDHQENHHDAKQDEGAGAQQALVQVAPGQRPGHERWLEAIFHLAPLPHPPLLDGGLGRCCRKRVFHGRSARFCPDLRGPPIHGRRWQLSLDRKFVRLPFRRAEGAQPHPERAPDHHRQDQGRREHGGHRERLEVCCHGPGQTLSHHIHHVHLHRDHRRALFSSPHYRDLSRIRLTSNVVLSPVLLCDSLVEKKPCSKSVFALLLGIPIQSVDSLGFQADPVLRDAQLKRGTR